jgi:hypothetical protein
MPVVLMNVVVEMKMIFGDSVLCFHGSVFCCNFVATLLQYEVFFFFITCSLSLVESARCIIQKEILLLTNLC